MPTLRDQNRAGICRTEQGHYSRIPLGLVICIAIELFRASDELEVRFDQRGSVQDGHVWSFRLRSILIRRQDQTLSERIDFTGPTFVERNMGEFGAFLQDRWTLTKDFTIDAGLRLDKDNIAHRGNFSPRFAVMYRPFKDDRTILRGGIGVFFDRGLLSSKYFDFHDLDEEERPVHASLTGLLFRVSQPHRYQLRTDASIIDARAIH